MKGDFSRLTFRPHKHYRGVLMQQGRVQVDADWNENLAILLHRIETETIDVVGECGVPVHDAAFGQLGDIDGRGVGDSEILVFHRKDGGRVRRRNLDGQRNGERCYESRGAGQRADILFHSQSGERLRLTVYGGKFQRPDR